MTWARAWSPLLGRFLQIFIQITFTGEWNITNSECAHKAFLSSSSMGARTTKLDNKSEQGNQLGGPAKRQLKIMEKRRTTEPGKEDQPKKKKTLQELHMDPPSGFRKFESEVDWQNMDEDIALQLWEDVFKPLYTFYEVRRITNHSDLSGPLVTISYW